MKKNTVEERRRSFIAKYLGINTETVIKQDLKDLKDVNDDKDSIRRPTPCFFNFDTNVNRKTKDEPQMMTKDEFPQNSSKNDDPPSRRFTFGSNETNKSTRNTGYDEQEQSDG